MSGPVPPIKEKLEFGRPGWRKLSDEQVWEIRERFLAGESKYRLAKEFKVSRTTIYAALHGENAYEGV